MVNVGNMINPNLENLPHWVYVIECVPTGQLYYGSSHRPQNRWKEHKRKANVGKCRLYRTIREHGKENFTFVSLCRFQTRKLAREFETTCILNAYKDGRAINQTLPDGRPLSGRSKVTTSASEQRRKADRADYWRRVREGVTQPPLDWVDGKIVPLSQTGIDQLGGRILRAALHSTASRACAPTCVV